EMRTSLRTGCVAGACARWDCPSRSPAAMFVEPSACSSEMMLEKRVLVSGSSRAGGATTLAASENDTTETTSPSGRLDASVRAAARAFSILVPCIEPDVSTTSARSIGARGPSGALVGTSIQTPTYVSPPDARIASLSGDTPTHVAGAGAPATTATLTGG